MKLVNYSHDYSQLAATGSWNQNQATIPRQPWRIKNWCWSKIKHQRLWSPISPSRPAPPFEALMLRIEHVFWGEASKVVLQMMFVFQVEIIGLGRYVGAWNSICNPSSNVFFFFCQPEDWTPQKRAWPCRALLLHRLQWFAAVSQAEGFFLKNDLSGLCLDAIGTITPDVSCQIEMPIGMRKWKSHEKMAVAGIIFLCCSCIYSCSRFVLFKVVSRGMSKNCSKARMCQTWCTWLALLGPLRHRALYNSVYKILFWYRNMAISIYICYIYAIYAWSFWSKGFVQWIQLKQLNISPCIVRNYGTFALMCPHRSPKAKALQASLCHEQRQVRQHWRVEARRWSIQHGDHQIESNRGSGVQRVAFPRQPEGAQHYLPKNHQKYLLMRCLNV